MSAAIQLVPNQKILNDKVVAEVESITNGSTEQKLRRVTEQVQQLQVEIRNLHAALAQAERSIAQKDVLLRNAALREKELRAELVKGVF